MCRPAHDEQVDLVLNVVALLPLRVREFVLVLVEPRNALAINLRWPSNPVMLLPR